MVIVQIMGKYIAPDPQMIITLAEVCSTQLLSVNLDYVIELLHLRGMELNEIGLIKCLTSGVYHALGAHVCRQQDRTCSVVAADERLLPQISVQLRGVSVSMNQSTS